MTKPDERFSNSDPEWLLPKISKSHRLKLTWFLKKFYSYYPNEKFTIFNLVRWIKQRNKDNKQTWLPVAGETGTGKSYFGLMMSALYGRPFSLTKNIGYVPKGDEIFSKLAEIRFGTYIIDEAARELRAVNWARKSQQSVVVKAQTDRYQQNLVMIMLPNFNELTKSLRETSVIMRAVLVYRTPQYARVIIHRKSRNWRSEDPWCDEEANSHYKRAEKKNGEISNDMILEIERKIGSYVMDFIVPNLELALPDVTNSYIYLKEKSRNDMSDDEEGEDPKSKKIKKLKEDYDDVLGKVTNMLLYNTLNLGIKKVTKSVIAKELNISMNKLNDALEHNRKSKFKSTDKPVDSIRFGKDLGH